jgi:hypothetical protein
MKKNKAQTHPTTWNNLENFMLNERNQTQPPTYCMVLFIWNVQNKQIDEKGNRVGAT